MTPPFLQAFIQYERFSYRYVQANLLVIALTIPIITAPAAYAALLHMTRTAHTGITTTFSDFWEGFRLYFKRATLLGVCEALVAFMLYINFTTYASGQGLAFVMLRVAWFILIGWWFMARLYAWPLLIVLDLTGKSAVGAVIDVYRNAFLMLFRKPVYTGILAVFSGVTALVSAVLVVPLVLLYVGVIANLTLIAVVEIISSSPSVKNQRQ
jgi:uncharacterized membrane protein YesL